MPINEYGMNDDIVEYFPLQEFVKKISLDSYVLKHSDETNERFIEYLDKFKKYDENYIIDTWIYFLYEELSYNQEIENIDFKKINLIDNEVFFNTLKIDHKRINDLHAFATQQDNNSINEYRKTEVDVSRFNEKREKEIFWRGAQAKDVKKFMDDFIEIYKHTDISYIMANPFFKSSLMHLLFVRIHPYTDGNGRTARLLHNAKFTEGINNNYHTKLKISPLNLSESILKNKITYVKCINNIYFDLKHDNNDAINKWFNMMLDRADEQIFLCSNKLDELDPANVEILERKNPPKMKIKKLLTGNK